MTTAPVQALQLTIVLTCGGSSRLGPFKRILRVPSRSATCAFGYICLCEIFKP